ncbi:LOW QUALITY PROTEIN: putative pheromone cAM373 precursor lipoprotein CamS [Geomicrobium sp. JCM 19037]|nr:LOW QUALITY PROTEIN: putative pheromone cAM373 precursor lipoprotein CamS [Geomicrobium sp. JCM 19037]
MAFLEPEEEADTEAEEAENSAEVSGEIPSLSNYYRTVFRDGSYEPGHARGFGTAMVHNRHDLERLEVGLSEIASETFSPEEYFIQEGQFIQRNVLNSWLRRLDETEDEDGNMENPNGLNPPLGEGETLVERERNAPRVLSHLTEHNFMRETSEGDLAVAGVAVAISLNSVYTFTVEDDEAYTVHLMKSYQRKSWMRQETGYLKKSLNGYVNLTTEPMASNLDEVPIVVAVYHEAVRESTTPGEFVSYAVADPGSSLGGWTELDETHHFFPSNAASDAVTGDADRFNEFHMELNSYFDDHIGATAIGYYQNSELRELTITVPIRFQSKMETIAVTQQVASLIDERFSSNVDIVAKVRSNDQQEALIRRPAGEEVDVYIYD